MSLTAGLGRRSYQKTHPNEHFPGKPGRNEALHLFWKPEHICLAHHPKVGGFAAKPNTLSAGNRSGSSLAAWVVWSHDWEPSVHINHNSSTLGGGNELREMPCVIKSETDWHSNKISSPTLCTLLGPWRGVYTRNSIEVTSYSWFRTTQALLSLHGQRAALIDVKPACSTWCCLLLLLMVTDRCQGTVWRECAALKTQRETNSFSAAKSRRLRQQIVTLTFLSTGAEARSGMPEVSTCR